MIPKIMAELEKGTDPLRREASKTDKKAVHKFMEKLGGKSVILFAAK